MDIQINEASSLLQPNKEALVAALVEVFPTASTVRPEWVVVDAKPNTPATELEGLAKRATKHVFGFQPIALGRIEFLTAAERNVELRSLRAS